MKAEDRITAFIELGKLLKALPDEEFKSWAGEAYMVNKWFTEENVRLALDGISKFLNHDAILEISANRNLDQGDAKRVGVIMAGNIPLAGFHDFLMVLLSGNIFLGKKSSQDPVLISKVSDLLKKIELRFNDFIFFPEKMNEADAIIATGSDNSSRYFEYYFSRKPYIIRKNRTSVAVFSGNESPGEINLLGKDIFTYFGLGCRNVSKIFIPEKFHLDTFFKNIQDYSDVVFHDKYGNNYDYNKAIYLLKKISILDNGFVLVKEDEGLVSPVAVIYYERYKTLEQLKARLKEQEEKIQIVVSADGWFPGSVPFGKAQSPEITDFADKVDTLEFALNIK